MQRDNNVSSFDLKQNNTTLILRQCIVLIYALLFIAHASAHTDSLSYSKLYAFDPDTLLSMAIAYDESFEQSNDCLDKAKAEAVRAFAGLKQGVVEGEFTVDCGTSWSFFVRGITDYSRARFKEAEASFLRSRSSIEDSDDPLLSLLWQNLGACRQVRDDLEGALLYYDSAYSVLPKNDGLLLRNNIASIHNELGNYSDALYHAQHVIEFAGDDPYILSLALYNALSASVTLNNQSDAKQYFEQLDKSNLISGLEEHCLNILFKYIVYANDMDWLGFLAEKHRDVILDEYEDDEVPAPFVLLARLYLMELKADFDGLFEIVENDILDQREKHLTSNLDETLRAQNNRLAKQRTRLIRILIALSVLIVIGILVYVFLQIRSSIQQKKALSEINNRLSGLDEIQRIKSALVKDKQGMRALEALIRLDGLLVKLQTDQIKNLPIHLLNAREREVLKLIVSGKNPHDVSLVLNVSTKYIYNIRSEIKRKFGVPQNESLENWLEQNYKNQEVRE